MQFLSIHDVINKEKDIVRDNWLKKEKFHNLKFWINDVLSNHEGVLSEIRKYFMTAST